MIPIEDECHTPGGPDGTSPAIDPELEAEGWLRRHLADQDRAKEAAELYSSLGFEVKLQKLTPTNFGASCQDCATSICSSYVMVLTRRKGVG